MKLTSLALAVGLCSVFLVGPAAAQQGMPMPGPGPEHAILKQDEGTGMPWWRCVAPAPRPDVQGRGDRRDAGLCLI
jgi:hypothetical protein